MDFNMALKLCEELFKSPKLAFFKRKRAFGG